MTVIGVDDRPLRQAVEALEASITALRVAALRHPGRASVYLGWASHLEQDLKSLRLLALGEEC
jgi:hypothetical protein